MDLEVVVADVEGVEEEEVEEEVTLQFSSKFVLSGVTDTTTLILYQVLFAKVDYTYIP